MNERLKKFAIPGLRWTVGLVILLQSVHFVISPSAGREFAQTGLPQWIRPALGNSEAIAGLLFLVSSASLVSGYFLLTILAIATGIHFFVGDFNVGAILVYVMAVIVCMAHSNKGLMVPSHDR